MLLEGRLTAETIVKKIEVLVNEEAMRVKMHRNADVYLSSDMGVVQPMMTHHVVVPLLSLLLYTRNMDGWVEDLVTARMGPEEEEREGACKRRCHG